MALEHFILYIIVFLYGIIIGSFLNVCIYRMPKGESVVTVGSHCMNCKHPLKWYDLFPVFSYLVLRGKCRYCGAKISIQYPLVELARFSGCYLRIESGQYPLVCPYFYHDSHCSDGFEDNEVSGCL